MAKGRRNRIDPLLRDKRKDFHPILQARSEKPVVSRYHEEPVQLIGFTSHITCVNVLD